jgi:hypothetical protein
LSLVCNKFCNFDNEKNKYIHTPVFNVVSINPFVQTSRKKVTADKMLQDIDLLHNASVSYIILCVAIAKYT